MQATLKIGFLGASRGMDYADHIRDGYPYAAVHAVCESYPPLCQKAREFFCGQGMDVACYTDFDTFLAESGIDALVIANFANEHAPYAIRALEKGIHVYSEVMPVQTLAEGAALCEAVEKSGCVYAYGENYCYFNPCFAMRKLYERGDIGEAVCLEGTFINDCSPKWDLLTRGQRDHWRNYVPATFYCSHSIGPLFFSTGLRATRVNGLELPWLDHMARVGARSGSGGMEVMELCNGGIARSMNGNYRHPYEASYRLIGEEGSITCNTKTVTLLRHTTGHEFEITPDEPAAPEFAFRPRCGKPNFAANSDCTAFGYFIGRILGDADCAKYSIGVYQALDMALPGLLAHRSILDGCMPYAVPDFRDPAVRAAYGDDRYSTDPRAEEKYRLATSKSGTPEVPDSVYDGVIDAFRRRDLTPGMK